MSASKYKIGDKVRIKSIDWYNRHTNESEVKWKYFPFSCNMKKYCGQIMTISIVRGCSYSMIEDDCQYAWTDEMIEGLAEEETKPKFKVGDKVKDKNNRVWFIVRVSETFFDISSVPNAQGYFVPIDDQDDYELVPQYLSNEIEMNNMKRNACQKCAFAVHGDNPHCGLRGFTTSFNVEWCESENDKAPNGYELQEDGYFSWVKKKTKYPKTFLECCDVLNIGNLIERGVKGYKAELFDTLQKLYICRNAYWKIAGEEMGLGKPWEPDYTNTGEKKFSIWVDFGEIKLGGAFTTTQMVLSFPTAEMRDAFKENFDPDIEFCKEFL